MQNSCLAHKSSWHSARLFLVLLVCGYNANPLGKLLTGESLELFFAKFLTDWSQKSRPLSAKINKLSSLFRLADHNTHSEGRESLLSSLHFVGRAWSPPSYSPSPTLLPTPMCGDCGGCNVLCMHSGVGGTNQTEILPSPSTLLSSSIYSHFHKLGCHRKSARPKS